jgi:dipeptidyl aminopeptidase/acylaminoacyl peptidase
MYGVLYRPKGAPQRAPAIVLIHGWMPYDSNPGMEYSYPAQEYANLGFVALAVTLRGWKPTGGKDDCGYQQPKDVVKAVQWLSSQEGVDPKRIALWGQSLGGQVALLAAATAPVRATVAYFPITDFRLWGVTTNHSEEMKREYIYGLCATAGTPESRSPLYSADRISGSVLLLHGDRDENVTLTHSKLLRQKMLEAGKDVTLYVARNGGHGAGGPGWENHTQKVADFLRAKLK